MSKNTRMLLVAANIILLLLLVFVRQSGQQAFIQLQEISQQQRVIEKRLSQQKIAYLQEEAMVPSRAKKQGFVMRER